MTTQKILVLASNPQGTEQLRLNPEIREIEDALERGQNREQFVLRSKVAVRVEDLQRSMLQEKARIVHFCGHGGGSQGLVLETTSGQQQLLDTQAIADLFRLFADQVECVVLNACYSEVQATVINQHINYVIGTKKEIRDDVAIAFSTGFYEALANGKLIEQAYEFGRNRIQLEMHGSNNSERKLVPIYSAAENKWIELPQHEMLLLLKKEPLKTFVEPPDNLLENNAAIKERPLIANSPYRGLKRFNAKDKDLFFGRERLINRLVEAVNQNNLVVVLGASGSGKSSVIRAGVLPQLELLQGNQFQSYLFTPNRDPFESLYHSLLNPEKDYDFRPQDAEIALEGKSDTLHKTIHRLNSKDSQWVIFIDQFEELFTICSNLEKRTNFIQGIISIAQDSDKSVKIILAMRSDFLEQLSSYPKFARIAEKRIHLVVDMQPDQLQFAIAKPAAEHGIVFESGLVSEIIQDVQGQAGSLPLLQYTLDLLWKDDDFGDRTLNIATYHRLGGVTGALQKHIDKIYQELTHEQKLATKQILLKLVDVVGLEKADSLRTAVSRKAYKSEFTEELQPTINLLINRSLLVSDNIDREGQSTIEIVHEALLTSWAELTQWIKDARELISINNRLADDTRTWLDLLNANNLELANDELWSGSKLEKIIELINDGTFYSVLGRLNPTADNFIKASIDRRDRETQQKITDAELRAAQSETIRKAEEEARQQAEKRAEEQAKANKKLRQIAWKLGIVSAIAVVLGIGLSYFGIRAQEQEQIAQLRQQAANVKTKLYSTNKTLPLLEAIQVVDKNQKVNNNFLFKLIHGFKSKRYLVDEVYSSLYQDYQNVKDSKKIDHFLGHEDSVVSVAFSNDGKYIVSGSADNTIKLWDVSKPTPIKTFNGHKDSVVSVAFSSDGKYIVSGSQDKTIKLWDISKPTPIKTFDDHKSWVNSVAFSNDGKYIISGSADNTIKLWDISKSTPIKTFDDHKSWVNSVAFSNDGKYIISGSADNTIKLWDMENKSLIHTFDDHQAAVNSVAFSNDGKYIISGSNDKTIKLWDMENKSLIHTFNDHKSWVNSVAFSNDGKYIISGSNDNTIKLWDWDMENKSLIHTFNDHQAAVNSVAFSNDGKYIISGSNDNTIKLWQTIDWRNWLDVECDKVRLKPIFVSTQTKTIPDATETCLKYGNWKNLEKAEFFVEQGLALAAEKVEVEKAKTKFEEAHNLDPAVNVAQLENQANQLAARTLIEEGKNIASNGDLDQAKTKFEEAHNLDPAVNVTQLQAEANQLTAQSLIGQGKELAKNTNLKIATTKFQEADQLDSAVDVAQLVTEAHQLAAQTLIEEGKNVASNGDLKLATTKFQEADELDSVYVDVGQLVTEAHQLAEAAAPTLIEESRNK